jgi:VanZ family protein
MKTKIYKVLSVILLAAVMATIFFLSHQNSTESTETSGFVTRLMSLVFGNVPESIVRTFGHFSEFCALGFLMMNCFFAFKEKLQPVHSILLSWGYAWTDEIHQIFVDGRAFQISDLLVDLTGIITGSVLIATIILLSLKITDKSKSKNQI